MRYTSEWFHVSVTLRFGELCVVDLYDVEGNLARTTHLNPAAIGKLVRQSALPRPAIAPTKRVIEDNAWQKRILAVGATGWRNFSRTTAEIRVSGDGHETRFSLNNPVEENDFERFSGSLLFLGLSSRLHEKQPRLGGRNADREWFVPLDLTLPGNRILIAPWHDPEMLGQAILNILAEALPPERDPESSVFDRPRPKQRNKLHLAAMTGDLSAFPKSTRGNRSFDPTDSELVTPLMLAARHGAREVVERLIALGADSSRVDERGQTPLHHAALGGHAPIVDVLMGTGAPVEATDETGRTPLHLAAALGQYDAAMRLLRAGALSDSKDDEYQSTPLHLVARGGHAHMVPLLLGQGADVETVNEAGRTPLHVAASYGNVDVVQALIDAGADVNRPDFNGESPLYRPVFFQHEDVLRLLIDAGGDVGVTNAIGDALLHVAAKMNRERAAAILVDSGADLEQHNAEGLTPLDCALVNPHFSASDFGFFSYDEHNAEVVALLAQRGALVDPMRLPVEERHILWPHLTPAELILPSGDIDQVRLFLGRRRNPGGIHTPLRATWRTLKGYAGLGNDKDPLRDERWPSLPESVRNALELASETKWQPHHQSDYVGEGQSIMHDAVSKDMPGLLDLMLSHGASQSPRVYRGRSLLHLACEMGFVEVARILLDRGADIEAPLARPESLSAPARRLGRNTGPGWTPLDTAIRSRQLDVIGFLLDRGAKPPDPLDVAEAVNSRALYRYDEDGHGFYHPLTSFLGPEKDMYDAVLDIFERRGTPIVGDEKRRYIDAEREEFLRDEARREAREARRAAKRT